MEYDENSIRFEMNYNGTLFYVSGKITYIGKDFLGSYVVRLDASGDGWLDVGYVEVTYPNQKNIPAKTKNMLANLEDGQRFTELVKGTKTYSYVFAYIPPEEKVVPSNQSKAPSSDVRTPKKKSSGDNLGVFSAVVFYVTVAFGVGYGIYRLIKQKFENEAFEKMADAAFEKKAMGIKETNISSDNRDSEVNHKKSKAAMQFCSECGAGVSVGAKFCESCGAQQENSAKQIGVREKSKEDCYDVLGIPQNSSVEDVKRAYRQLAVKYHPDKNPGDKDAVEKFREVTDACKTLLNIKENFMPFCTNCGADITEEVKFCMNCGKPIDRNVAV
jgi:predicted RNA-binding Zn-ribbon protein involved in translation (DUF1610 family)